MPAENRIAKRIFYFADPMCSWCWGFSPVIARIVADYGERAPVRLVAGGLRVGTTEPMDERAKAAIRGHWEHVQATTGQPFDFAFFEREGFVYDTGPACRAVVAMRNLSPDQTFPYLETLHRAFYAEEPGRDRGGCPGVPGRALLRRRRDLRHGLRRAGG